MSAIRPPTKAEVEASNMHKREKAIRHDICKIDAALTEDNIDKVKATHLAIDGKYQSSIADWGKSMYSYSEKYGFDYGLLSMDSMKHNLSMMKSKLEGFIFGWNKKSCDSINASASDVNVTVNNMVSITITFDEARQKIEDMPGLTAEESADINTKIDELEKISKEPISRKNKWEKVKPIISFAIDKGADVAITVMGLILQMKLGI